MEVSPLRVITYLPDTAKIKIINEFTYLCLYSFCVMLTLLKVGRDVSVLKQSMVFLCWSEEKEGKIKVKEGRGSKIEERDRERQREREGEGERGVNGLRDFLREIKQYRMFVKISHFLAFFF